MTPEERKEYMKQWYQEHKVKRKAYDKQWRSDHKEQQKNNCKKWRKENEEEIKEYNKQYNEVNKEKRKEQDKQRYQDNKEENKKYGKQHYQDNKEEQKQKAKEWRQNHKEEQKEYGKQWGQTIKGKLIQSKHRHKRRRELGFNPLNNWFEGSHGHHIDTINVIFIPASLHKKYQGHRLNRPQSMIQINIEAFKFMNPDVYTHLIEDYTLNY